MKIRYARASLRRTMHRKLVAENKRRADVIMEMDISTRAFKTAYRAYRKWQFENLG